MNAKASAGRRRESPRNVEMSWRAVAARADQGDDGERAEHHERVGEQVEERPRRCPARVAACTPTRMNPAWLIDEYASIRFTSVWMIASADPTIS